MQTDFEGSEQPEPRTVSNAALAHSTRLASLQDCLSFLINVEIRLDGGPGTGVMVNNGVLQTQEGST